MRSYIIILIIILTTIILEYLLKKRLLRIITVITSIIICSILSSRVSVSVANTLSWTEYLNGFNVVFFEIDNSWKQKNHKRLTRQLKLINSHLSKGVHDQGDMSLLISDLLNMDAPLGSKK